MSRYVSYSASGSQLTVVLTQDNGDRTEVVIRVKPDKLEEAKGRLEELAAMKPEMVFEAIEYIKEFYGE